MDFAVNSEHYSRSRCMNLTFSRHEFNISHRGHSHLKIIATLLVKFMHHTVNVDCIFSCSETCKIVYAHALNFCCWFEVCAFVSAVL